MLLTNICPPKLCNSKRMRVIGLRKSQTKAKVITGSAKEESVFILRMSMIRASDNPFQSERVRFPVEVCFADHK